MLTVFSRQPQVVANMVEAFENTKGHLSQRLVAALEGGQWSEQLSA